MKIGNIIFIVLGAVVLVCGILNIINPLVHNYILTNVAVGYLQEPSIPVVAIGLIATGLGMIIKGVEDNKIPQAPKP